MKKIIFLLVFILFVSNARSNEPFEYNYSCVYKTIDTTKLSLHFITPASMSDDKEYPAIVFFFGGGWIGGSVKQFEPQAKYLAQRGVIAVLAEYRVEKRNGTTPFDAVEDAKSAIRYLRANASGHKINPDQIVAAGGSAGGHLAAATATLEELNAPNDDLSVSCVPNALVLFNPVIDNGPDGYGYERIKARHKEISPLHNIHQKVPPTIIFLGTKDHLIPVETMIKFKNEIEAFGGRCDLFLYEGQKHGFFNLGAFNKNSPEFFNETMYRTDLFLMSLHYIPGGPKIKSEIIPIGLRIESDCGN
ncbi:alpha/beta hydrolase [Marinilabilia rubra]|uniref:Peptidase S9 n=1 Tax=Marinilabilia rubra TaxID=2162893 RepID=A0A2U2BE87_9BACT|nr:alpha/beta hydrolase [Marinilabilia rubra]PWE01368.1 peptidase S9 [Marinilabilia rubra]